MVEQEANGLSNDARAALCRDVVNDAQAIISKRFETIGWRYKMDVLTSMVPRGQSLCQKPRTFDNL